MIRFAIAHYRGQMSEVARRLRIGRSTLYRKLESLGLQRFRRQNRAGTRVFRVTAAQNRQIAGIGRVLYCARPRIIIWSARPAAFMSVFDHKGGAITPPSGRLRRNRCGVFILTGFSPARRLRCVLTLSGQAQSQSNSSSIDAAVPVPEAADVPPPTAADIAKSAPTITPGRAGRSRGRTRRTGATATANAGSGRTRRSPRPHRQQRRPLPSPRHPPIRFAEKLREILTGKSDRLFSRKGEKAASRRSTASATTRRSGSITARRARARPKPSPICAASMPTASSRPNIRCPISNRPIPTRWPKPNSNSPTRCSTFARHAQTGRVHWARQLGHLLRSGSGRARRRARQASPAQRPPAKRSAAISRSIRNTRR